MSVPRIVPRLLVTLFVLAAALGSGLIGVVAPPPAAAQALPDDPARGLVYDGLRRSAADSLCDGAFEAFIDEELNPWTKLCTHGPDPAPEGVDVREDRGPDPAAELDAPSAATAGSSTTTG